MSRKLLMHDPSYALLFVDIVERGSIAAAARAHQISRATAARRLASLEEGLGVQLVTRTTHALSLTSAGEAYLPHAQAVRAALTRAEDAARDAVNRPQGVIRIVAPIVNHDRFLMPLLKEFTAAYPEINAEVILGADVRRLVAEGFDVGLQVGLEDNAELIMRRLLIDHLILVASPSYLARRGAPQDIAALDDHDCLMAAEPDGAPQPWPLGEGRTWVPTRARLLSNSHELIIGAAVSGLGITMLPRAVLFEEFARGMLVQVLPEVSHKEWFSLVYSATRIVPPNVRAFVDFTTAWFGALLAEQVERGDDFDLS